MERPMIRAQILPLIICICLFSCSDSANVPDVVQQMPKGFTNDSVRITSVVPYADTTYHEENGSYWANEEWFVIKNYSARPINLYSYRTIEDSIWNEFEQKWIKTTKKVTADTGWFFIAKKSSLEKVSRLFLDDVRLSLAARDSLVRRTPTNGSFVGHIDLLNREGDTLYLYKYNKTDTVLVDMIWWKDAQRNQVIYHQ